MSTPAPPEPQRVAVLDETGLVVNVALVEPDSDWTPGDGLTLEPLSDDDHVGPGWSLDAQGEWQAPRASKAPAPEPTMLEAMRTELDALRALVMSAR